MEEYKINMIHDGGAYKISYAKNGKQFKVTIGSEKSITVMAARKICKEVEEILGSEMEFSILKKLYAINRDAQMCGYKGSVIKYQNISIEIAVKIMDPENIDNLITDHEDCKPDTGMKPLELLNIGCTGSGKTRFIIGAFLSKEALKNFVPALTSLKETTACSIIYHLNAKNVTISEGCNFMVDVELKNEEEIQSSIKELVIEAVDEYINTVKSNSKQIADIDEICIKCREAVAKRFELNYDKTFGLGKRKLNARLADAVEELTMRALIGFYGSSKSIAKLAGNDRLFIIRQLIRDFEDEQFDIRIDEISIMLDEYQNEALLLEMIRTVFEELKAALEEYKKEYGSDADIGGHITYSGNAERDDTLIRLSHVFGNKSKQRKGEFYTIEPIVKKAEFYFKVEELADYDEIVLSDSIGINQGQKDTARIKEIVFNRVQEAIQTRKPDIILYHTKLNDKDDYMLDVVKKLNAQGYGKAIFIVSGRLDEVLSNYLAECNLEMEDLGKEIFDEFLEEVKQIYVQSDSVTLNSIVGDRYYVCDKTNRLADKYEFATDYGCPAVLKEIIALRPENEENKMQYSEIEFMKLIQENNVPGNVYQKYLDKIPSMVPLNYHEMRWNTLQKAIEELRWNRYGFDVLYPAFNIKNAISEELNRDEIRKEFTDKFGDEAEEMKRRYLLEVTDVAQIVLVTEYRLFMRQLLRMRYDTELRTNLSTSMTNDRKDNLHKLYKSCLEQEGMKGAYALKIIFHIAWVRTIRFFEMNA